MIAGREDHLALPAVWTQNRSCQDARRSFVQTFPNAASADPAAGVQVHMAPQRGMDGAGNLAHFRLGAAAALNTIFNQDLT